MSMLRNEDLKNRCNLSIQNRYEILAIEDGFQLTDERQIENQWKMLIDSMVNAAKEALPCQKKETKQSWMTKDILAKMRERKKANSNDQAKYNRLGKEIEMARRRAKEWWHTKCGEVETLQSQHRTTEMHENIKEVTEQGRKQKGSNCIKDKNGHMLFDENKIKKIWEEHVTALYKDTRGNPPDVDDTGVLI